MFDEIDCHYCGGEIKTISQEGSPFFQVVDGKFTIVNGFGDKEAVCNKCLEGQE